MTTTTPSDQAAPETLLRSVHTSNLPALLAHLQSSLVVSTYQAGKVIVVRAEGDRLNTHFRPFAKPMGLAATRARLTIGGAHSVWDYRNMPADSVSPCSALLCAMRMIPCIDFRQQCCALLRRNEG